MSGAYEKFEEFRRRYLADGDADPREFLAGAEDEERAELSLLIEHFLLEQPPRPWDEEEFHASGAAALVERVVPEVTAAIGTTGERLSDLRNSARIGREDLVARLAEELRVSDEFESVRFYYHHMEHGTLPLKGVSEAVFTALSRLLKVSVDRIRKAAEASQRQEGGTGEAVFARTVTGTQAALEVAEADSVIFTTPDGRDEVARLFTAG